MNLRTKTMNICLIRKGWMKINVWKDGWKDVGDGNVLYDERIVCR